MSKLNLQNFNKNIMMNIKRLLIEKNEDNIFFNKRNF